MGTLYVVATPIGNLGDMTPRAVETLRAVNVIAAEDTRHSATLLRHFEIRNRTLSYHQHNQRARRDVLLNELEAGDVALITDAGTPAIADPGNDLVATALAAGHKVVPVPGASSLSAAVSVSGLVDGAFLMLGFLPRTGEDRRRQIGKAVAAGFPFVIFESPLRIIGTLGDLQELCGDRRTLIARELTKLHEELRLGTMSDLIAHYDGRDPKGEIVVVVAGADSSEEEEGDDVVELVRRLLASGIKPSRAAREAAQITGRNGSEMYDLVRKLSSKTSVDPG